MSPCIIQKAHFYLVVIRFAPIAVSYITFKPFTQKKSGRKTHFSSFYSIQPENGQQKKEQPIHLKLHQIVFKTIQLDILRHRLPLNQPSINVIQAFRMIIRFFLNASNYWLFFSYIFFLL